MNRQWLHALSLVLLLGCRTPPIDAVDGGMHPAPDAAISGAVSCGPGVSCAIADGEHCCAGSTLLCQTAPCLDADQFDCDGPEDCGGSPCCFPIRNAFSLGSCAATCTNATVLCHTTQDCPANTICCLNFVLGPANGLCLGACD
jgi:hypothetical protein